MSAFVLPERMPVADDGPQRMFPDWDKLLELERLRLELARLKLQREQTKTLRKLRGARRNGHEPEPMPKPDKVRAHRPQNKLFREWLTFRAYFQQLEKRIRRDHQLGPDDEVSREMVCTGGGLPTKTLGYHMEWHGLNPNQWPPSTWPEQAPQPP